MEQAIKKAIEGGLDYSFPISPRANPELLFLNPIFWQCLGRSLGWSSKRCTECGEERCKKLNHDFWEYVWQYQWHNFIDHLAEGKDIDSFFKELLNNK